jgi:Leucine-rich repeat (LRR) protein
MTITIKYIDNVEHTYNAFDDILQLDNYNDIIYIKCTGNRLSYLPELPNSLQVLWCNYNNLSSLPELPNSLERLWCANNNLSVLPELPNLTELLCPYNKISKLPELPNSLKYLHCSNNNISNLPKLPNSLKTIFCHENSLSSLPELPHSLNHMNYDSNPIYTHIENYFNGVLKNYFEYQKKMKREFANKIGNWFLDCKYNPKYLYCRKILMKEYEELYN